MTDRVLQEIKQLQQDGPSAELTSKAKEGRERGYETALKQNGYWLRPPADGAHASAATRGEILTRPARIDAITPRDAAGDVQEVLPAGSLHGRDADAGGGRRELQES